MKKYSNVMNTNVTWIPQIPAHWKLQKINALFTERKKKVSDKDYKPLSVTKKGILPQLEHAAKSNDSDNRKLVKKGDFVINSRSDRKGSCGVSRLDGSVSLINIVLTPSNELNSEYIHYLLRNYRFSEEYYRNGRGIVADLWTTRYSEMRTILFPVPPRAEQNQIVRFLDWKVSEINKLTSIRKKQIKQLEEIKEKQIENALSHFSCQADVQPLKAIAYCNRESLSESTAENYSFRYIDIGSVDEKEGITHYEEMEFKNAPSRARRIVHKNDIIISTVRTYLKAITRITDDKDVIVSTGFAVLSLHGVDSKYLEYYFKSKRFCDEVIRESIGIAYPAIDTSKLMRIKILVPKYEEQLAITAQVHKNEILINQTISLLKKKIKQLQELKSTLISDVVTGKIDVRNIPVPAYEHVDDLTADDGEGNDEETGIPGEED